MSYTNSICLECNKCGDIQPSGLEDRNCSCGGQYHAVSCLPERVPPVHTRYWDAASWARWYKIQRERQKRLTYLNEKWRPPCP